jgi:hypothetical protein
MTATAPRATPTPMPVLAPLLRPEDDFEIVAPPVELELLLAPPAVTVTVAGTVPVLVVDMPVLVVSNRPVLVLREDAVVSEDVVRVEADLDVVVPVLVVRADVVIVEEEGAAMGTSPSVVGARVC